jgi:transposase
MRPYEYSDKESVISYWKAGQSGQSISNSLSIGYRSVLRWINLYKLKGEAGLTNNYKNCGGRVKVSHQIKQAAIGLKSVHEGWGADYIKMKLEKKYPESYIPSARQLRNYFKSAGLVEEKTKLPDSSGENKWVKQAFSRVQVDAKEQIQTLDGNWCSYLTFTDEYTGGVLEALVFPL